MSRRCASTVDRADIWLLRWGARSGIISWLYYAVWSGKLRREERAVLAGRLKFKQEALRPVDTSAQLRRGVHRLEKGLLMRPRREVFALDYIAPTLATYEAMVRRGNWTQAAILELRWAHDVLKAYFEATTSHPKIDPLRASFLQLPAPADDSVAVGAPLIPFRRNLESPVPVSFDSLMALSIRRRSVRWFAPRTVPRELICQAVELAAQSPSACNRQPFYFRVFDDPALARSISEIPAGTSGFSHQFPAVVVVVGQLRAYSEERDRHVIYIDAALASMSFVYALETLGLSSCCINWPDIEDRERAMEQALGLEADERPVMLIAVGYPDPDGLVACSQKKSVGQLCRFNNEKAPGPVEDGDAC